MLILSRRPGESVLIGPNVTVTLLSVRGHQARLGVDAPKRIYIHRPDATVRLHADQEPDPALNALQQFGTDYIAALYLFHLAQLGIADALGAEPMTAAEIAEKVRVDPQALRRALCFVASCGVFSEDSDGRFRHNALSLPLRTEHPHSLRAWFCLCAAQPSGSTLDAIGLALHTGRPAPELMTPVKLGSTYMR